MLGRYIVKDWFHQARPHTQMDCLRKIPLQALDGCALLVNFQPMHNLFLLNPKCPFENQNVLMGFADFECSQNVMRAIYVTHPH